MNNTYYITHFTEYKRWDQRVIWMDSIKIELNTVDKEFLLLLLRWWRRIHYFAHLIEWYSWMYGISSMPIDGSFIQLETANEYWWLITKYDWCQDEEGPPIPIWNWSGINYWTMHRARLLFVWLHCIVLW